MRKGWVYEGPAEEIEDIIYKVKMLPIATVLSHYGVCFQKMTGNRALALCPYHMDNHIGSFSVNISTNSCWCYACNQGGNTIKAISLMTKKSYVETALQIAADEGLIDKDKFEELSSVKYEQKAINHDDLAVHEITEDSSVSSKKTELYNDVYEAFKAACSLSKEHFDYLQNERNLSEDRIQKDYFSMPACKDIDSVINKMRKILNGKYTLEEVASVPGFYLEKMGANGVSKWVLGFLNYAGIGIILRNFEGKAIAIQIRTNSASCRYTFMSGKQYGSNFKGGNSIGTVLDYLPCEKPSSKIAITEGRFKSEILRLNGYNVISVQGVNNFKGIVPIIKASGLSRIDIFYDADMIKNPQVCAAEAQLIRYLKNGLTKTTINVIVWDYENGKGIDDLILAGHKGSCKKIGPSDYVKAVDHTLEEAIVECGFDKDAPANQFTKEDRNRILSVFETLMRARLDLRKEYKFFG